MVRHNCVRDVIGMDIDDSGRLMRPFFTWSVYLDNFATGFTVEGNILSGNVLGGVFIHGGSSNKIVNNVLVNSDNTSMPGAGHYGVDPAMTLHDARHPVCLASLAGVVRHRLGRACVQSFGQARGIP